MYRQLRLNIWLASLVLGGLPFHLHAAETTPKKSVVVNGIAAEISGKPVTLRDVYQHRGLDRVKSAESGLLHVETGEALRSAVQKYILEDMVFREMKSLNFDGGPKSDAVKILQTRKTTPGFKSEWDKYLAHFRLNEEQAIAALWRSIQVDRFIEKKVETLTPLLTPDVVDRYILANTPQWEGMSEEKRRELRQRTERLLKKERMGEQLKDWVLRLKRKYAVVQYL